MKLKIIIAGILLGLAIISQMPSRMPGLTRAIAVNDSLRAVPPVSFDSLKVRLMKRKYPLYPNVGWQNGSLKTEE